MTIFEQVKLLIGDVLQLGDGVRQVDGATTLLGSILEFDSMAVVSLITAIEEHFGIVIEDDEISAETFRTVGSVYDFVSHKLNANINT